MIRHTATLTWYLRRREEDRRERRQRAREFEEATWAAAEAEGSDEEDAPEEELPDELYCLACDKLFRTLNAMANHKRSGWTIAASFPVGCSSLQPICVHLSKILFVWAGGTRCFHL